MIYAYLSDLQTYKLIFIFCFASVSEKCVYLHPYFDASNVEQCEESICKGPRTDNSRRLARQGNEMEINNDETDSTNQD